jgi:hypothetical protein
MLAVSRPAAGTASWCRGTGTGPRTKVRRSGSAKRNSLTYGVNGGPDPRDRNQVIGNTIGPNTSAGSVAIEDGTTGGIVRDNTFDGTGNDRRETSPIPGSTPRATATGSRTTTAVTRSSTVSRSTSRSLAGATTTIFPETPCPAGHGITVAGASTGTTVACDNPITAAVWGYPISLSIIPTSSGNATDDHRFTTRAAVTEVQRLALTIEYVR